MAGCPTREMMMMMKKLPENVADGLDRRGCGKRKKEICQGM